MFYMRKLTRWSATLAASALMAGGFVSVVGMSAASAATAPAISASTHLTNHPDSGNHGTWANDNFTRVATIKFVSQVAASHCPGTDTGFCYLWNFTLSDKGTFTTIPGGPSPRQGVALERALTGKFSGGTATGEYFSSWKTAKASRVPAVVNGPVTGRQTSSDWAEQFYGASAVFNSDLTLGHPDLGKWRWLYTLGFGSNGQCPNNAYQWADGILDGGTLARDGEILTPTAAHC